MHALFALTVCFFVAPVCFWVIAPRDHGFLAGAGAAAAGEDASVCPYAKDSARHEAWQAGFHFVKARI
jgi:hypothetical protein